MKADSTFASVPRALFAAPPDPDPGDRLLSTYSVTADGQRFLFSSSLEESISTPITVVFNWTAELPRNELIEPRRAATPVRIEVAATGNAAASVPYDVAG